MLTVTALLELLAAILEYLVHFNRVAEGFSLCNMDVLKMLNMVHVVFIHYVLKISFI